MTLVLATALAAGFAGGCAEGAPDRVLRVVTFNVEDVRTTDLTGDDQPRIARILETLHDVRPDVVLVNELAYDLPGVAGFREEDGRGANAARLAARLSAHSGRRYTGYAWPSNTGLSSGYDLDNSGVVVDQFPPVEAAASDGAPPPQTAQGRAYGGDSWGFGTFPGQYAMAVLVADGFEVLEDQVRTFQYLQWQSIPDAMAPSDPESGEPWYDTFEWRDMRLSSKSHWVVPIRDRHGRVFDLLASHPTPPAFDGPEGRNKKRNHDEIRLWAEYLDGASYVVDDDGVQAPPPDRPFVVMGDLNADPDEGSSVGDPVGRWLLTHPRVNGSFVPSADSAGVAAFPTLDPDDTSLFGMRVDYVLPSADWEVVDGGILRTVDPPSDHFPVWVDLRW